MSWLHWRRRNDRHKTNVDLSTVASPKRCMRGARGNDVEPERVPKPLLVYFPRTNSKSCPLQIVSLIVGGRYWQARCAAQHCADEWKS